MTKKGWIVLCIIEAIIIGLLVGYILRPKPIVEPDIKEIVRDSIIRDSIFIEIEKIKTKVIYVEKQFKKDSHTIMSTPDSLLFSNFSKYVNDYNNK